MVTCQLPPEPKLPAPSYLPPPLSLVWMGCFHGGHAHGRHRSHEEGDSDPRTGDGLTRLIGQFHANGIAAFVRRRRLRAEFGIRLGCGGRIHCGGLTGPGGRRYERTGSRLQLSLGIDEEISGGIRRALGYKGEPTPENEGWGTRKGNCRSLAYLC
jgi:hypothetical protein